MRSSKQTIARRIEQVLELRVLGASFHEIRRWTSEQQPPWNVSDRQIWRYIEESDKLMAETLEADREKIVSRHRAQRRAIYARSMATSDYRTALAALDSEVKLLRLTEPPAGKVPADAKAATPADVIAILSRQLAEIDGAKEMPASDKARMTTMLGTALLQMIDARENKAKLQELIDLLNREEKTGNAPQ
jgi:hypothetical protein